MRRGSQRLCVFAIVCAVVLPGCPRRFPSPGEPIATAGVAAPTPVGAGSVTARSTIPDFTALIRSCGAAVVNVAVVQVPSGDRSSAPEPEDPLEDFLRRFGIPLPPRGPVRGMGSGFIVSADGYILTNAHVVKAASEVRVKLTDRREFPARVVGADSWTDVAVLKIDARDLPVVKFGDATRLRPGQWVVAIGAPFGFENSATAGIVSGTARTLPGEGYVPFIQTDVAVNPGNSGGPLFNLDGEVVGINSQILSRTGGYMGISFAVPIDVAREVQRQLVSRGRVVRGRIGVTVQDMNAQLAESFGLDRPRGALVSSVERGGPADQAHIKPGDVVLQVNGADIEYASRLSTLISALEPGRPVTLTLWRDRKTLSATARVAELKEARQEPVPSRREAGESAGEIGLATRPLTREEREALSTEGRLVVTEASGAAALAGIQPGDVVLAVNGAPVRTMKELREALTTSGKVAALLIEREGSQIFVPIPLRRPAR